MRIVDLSPELEPLYLVCLEDWSPEIREVGDHKRRWYDKMKGRGLRVKIALDDTGTAGGMIQYLPIEHAFAEGKGLYFILCIWVHGHKQGRGNFQGRGMGTMLLQAAEEDARALGAKGMAAWGMSLPVFMRASWFKKHGYRKADRMGIQVLLWKPFAPGATPPRWIREKKRPQPMPGVVSVVAFVNGWCQAMNLTAERARRAAAGFGDAVAFTEVNTSERSTFMEWGISDALFVDGKQVRTGPPPSEEKIRNLIARRVRKLPKR
ncbi:MAG: GNAT family N-acetyltransferase [Candidatus Bipolaricaulota bacterium]